MAGGAQQRLRHVGARACRGGGTRREVRARVDRQGGESDQRDGRVEAPRRDRLPGDAGRRDAVRDGALRQRLRQRRQRDPALFGADRARRPGDGHAPRHHALLHVDLGGGAARAAGRAAGEGRRDPRARHGRAGAHRRSRARHDPPLGRRPGPRPDRVHRAFAPARSSSRSRSPTTRRRCRRRTRSCASRRRARRTAMRSARWSRGASAIASRTTPKCARG